jgi:putative ABC transport system permease protein
MCGGEDSKDKPWGCCQTIISPLYAVVRFAVIMLTYQLSKMLCAKKVNAVYMSEALKVGPE